MNSVVDERIEIYDTTLRDGTQREGISLTVKDKLRIADRLDAFGVTFIEGGWPGSNPKDAAFFDAMRDRPLARSTLCAFGATRRASITPEDDDNLAALIDAGTPACTLFGKTWPLHVTRVLRTTLDENLRMIEDSVAYLVAHGRRVIYDAEHFFDGWRDDPVYALETLQAAICGGAEVLVLCDTNGGSMPWDVGRVVAEVRRRTDHAIGVHAHDDTGCAVANSMAAIIAGARHVQGTINGYGERCGNANLCTVIANLQLKLGARCIDESKLAQLYDLSHYVAEVANLSPDENLPYTGRRAFAHKGGVHVCAMRRDARSYQHIEPDRVGNQCRVLVSELSGRSNVLSKAEELGLRVPHGQDAEVLAEIKAQEALGCSFEAAEASVALMLERRAPGYQAPFEVLDHHVICGQRGSGEPYTEATMKLSVGDVVTHTAADGNGPVNALDGALRKALLPQYPAVASMKLADYKVRVLDGTAGTAATTRVLVDVCNETCQWTSVGASTNIIEASLKALIDGIEYGLARMSQPRSMQLDRGPSRGANPEPRAAQMEAS